VFIGNREYILRKMIKKEKMDDNNANEYIKVHDDVY
jgi:hypothetical protein